jgi:hypothetical protein
LPDHVLEPLGPVCFVEFHYEFSFGV